MEQNVEFVPLKYRVTYFSGTNGTKCGICSPKI